MLETAADRFDRRLSEELGMFRAEVAREFVQVRAEIAAARAENANEFAAVRVDMARMNAGLLRWMFVFWIGQLMTVLSIVAMVLRVANLL